MLRTMLVVLGIGSSLPVLAQDWDSADRATKRLGPAMFVELPAGIRLELVRRGCTIPQPFTAKGPENVIKGRFTSASQTDWAVLCARQRRSAILVFRGGVASDAAELAAEADVTSLQTIDGNGTIGYSRTIAVATSRYIQDHYRRYGGPKPPPLDHEGINDVFIEKASVVWYWYQNRWLRLQGAD
jgi:hypothetical protein